MLEPLLHSVAGREIFDETRILQSMLDFEAALARAQFKVGIVPFTAAERIAACCKAAQFNLEALRDGAAVSGNTAIPLVKQLTALVREKSPEAAGFVHFGATSQDVIDTALVLQLRVELELVEALVGRACDALALLTRLHRDTPMAGRTWLQQAVPITFGLKTAGWLDSLLRHRERLLELRPRVLVLQFGGAAGSLASLGGRGVEVATALAGELNLALPDVPWHANRDRIAEVATFHGLLAGTLGKIARDISLLMQTEIADAAEASAPGRGGSSTMPHKRNPVACAAILAAAIRVPGLVGTVLSAMPQEHERGLGGWHAEWETLPEICTITLGALEKTVGMLIGLQVFPEAMRQNLDRTNGLIFAEAISMALAASMGKDRAHAAVEEASLRASSDGKPLREVIQASTEMMAHLTPTALDVLFDPGLYLGASGQMIDSVLQAYASQKSDNNKD